MQKYKISAGLAAVLLIGGLISGLSSLLIIAVLMLIFCEIDKKTSNLMAKILSFIVGLTIVSFAWSIIFEGIHLIDKSLDDVVSVINSYLSSGNYINLGKLDIYLISPILKITDILDELVNFVLLVVKYGFILSILIGKPIKSNAITNKINEFINYVVKFMQNVELNNSQQNNNVSQNMNNNLENQNVEQKDINN